MICQLPDCTNKIIATGRRGPRPKFCSKAHKQKHYRQTRSAEPITPTARSVPLFAQQLVTAPAGPQTRNDELVTEPARSPAKRPTQLLLEHLLRSYELDAERFRDVDDFLFTMYSTLARQTEANLKECEVLK